MKLKIQKDIRQGMYVQFDISGNTNQYNVWHKDSLYLDEVIFGVFLACFEKSVEKLIYYGPTCFRETELLRLQQELENNRDEFNRILSADDLINKILQMKVGRNFLRELELENFDLNTGWKGLVGSLVEINDTLVELTQKCIRENRVLWVLGI